MSQNRHYLDVTFRKGRPFAAYLHLRSGSAGARTEQAGERLFIDYHENDQPVGVEIIAPGEVSLEDINSILFQLGIGPTPPQELRSLAAV